ncbi:hypothetical protein [Undibacterium flavidum]|uniref:Uncharacterized protein n=1 Tax=Undibacterium flavidum TaxID=2762297 RepID=A0ABR6Y5V4_9BURK|nr:hypothetical protein [Undibacterium flavidum]MBC3872000.1 hypothetical protein [Undibacterium flavidum]
MIKKHLYLVLAQVKPGDILAEELLDKIGHVLLPAGTTLTASMLKAIGNHHIHQLSIQNVENQEASTANEEETRENNGQQLERLNRLFRHGPYEGPTEILRSYITKYRQGEAS